jgi:hypothetical protein
MVAKDVTSNYSLFSDRGLEGHVSSLLPGAYFSGTAEGLFNDDAAPLPFGRVVVFKSDSGVGLPTATGQAVAGVTFYQAQFEANAQFAGDAGTPADYPVTLARRNVIMFMMPETNIDKGSSVFFRAINKGTVGANEALGRIRSNADALTITNVALTSNVATITVANHGLTVGQVITIAGLTTTALNGTHTITAVPTANTFTFALTNANISSTSDSGTIARAAALSGVRLIEDAVAGTPVKVELINVGV